MTNTIYDIKHFQIFPSDPPECEVMTGYSQLDMQVSYAWTLDCGCCTELSVAALTYHCIAMPGILYSSSMCQVHENHQTTGTQVCKCWSDHTALADKLADKNKQSDKSKAVL